MGMFDDIKYDGRDFQTKDLHCELDQYMIEGGRLLKRRWDRDSLISEEGTPVEAPPEDTNYHGWLNFYRHDFSNEEGSTNWEEYNAKFTDGQMVECVKAEDARR